MKLKVYVAGAIRGDRRFIESYRGLISHLEAREDCEALAEMSLVGRGEKLEDDAAIYARDRGWLDRAQVMVAEISAPSLGVGYEIAYALHVRKIPVLALKHASVKRSSAMLEGNDSPLFEIQTYRSESELLEHTDRFIETHSRRRQ